MSRTSELARDVKTTTAELDALARDPAVAPQSVADRLDALPARLRSEVVRGLSRRGQAALYAKVRGFAPVSLVELVPAGRRDLETVRHLGRNTLPAFTLFEKRFCRLPGDSPESPARLAGWNFQALSSLTGPGHFTAFEDPGGFEVLVDYRVIPPTRPADWPELRPNDRGLGRLVYGSMVDTLRRVARDVTIGSAAKHGRDLGSYFVLCRDA